MGNLVIIILVLSVSTFLFTKAAGTLSLGKLNIVSYAYYVFLLQSFVGASLIALGFDKHYTLNYLLQRESSISATIAVIWITAVLFPLMIFVWEKVFRFNVREKYDMFLHAKTAIPKKNELFTKMFIVGSILCAVILLGYLIKIGYIPLMKLIYAPEGFDFATERVRISKIYFLNSYVNNIVLFTIVPLMAYISFAYMLTTNYRIWKVLFGVLFCMSCICKTYKFEKTPVIFHLLVFVLIFLLFKGGIKLRHMLAVGGILGVCLVLAYFATGYSGKLLDIYNGPIGRTFFTQVGTLSYHIDLFPNVFGFLNGRSFSPTILKLLGIGSEKYLRSAKLVMAFYGSEKVYDGTAGVMNTVFLGEAYANWGYAGIAVSIVWVALVIAVLMWMILRLKKTPCTLCMMALLTVRIGSMLQGGFCDFIYSFDILFTCAVLLGVYGLFENER